MTMKHLQDLAAARLSPIKRIQHVGLTITSGNTSGTATLGNAVTEGNTLVIRNGWRCNSSAFGNGYAPFLSLYTLTNPTTITAELNSAAVADVLMEFCVVEFHSWAVKSKQVNTVNFPTGGGSGTQTRQTNVVGTLNKRASLLVPSGMKTNGTAQSLENYMVMHSLFGPNVDDFSNVHSKRNLASSTITVDAGYQIMEFNNDGTVDGECPFLIVSTPIVNRSGLGNYTQGIFTMSKGETDLTWDLSGNTFGSQLYKCMPEFTSLLNRGYVNGSFQNRHARTRLYDERWIETNANVVGGTNANCEFGVNILQWDPKIIRKISRGVFELGSGTATDDLSLNGDHLNSDKMMVSMLGFEATTTFANLVWPSVKLVDEDTLRFDRLSTGGDVFVSWEVTEFY